MKKRIFYLTGFMGSGKSTIGPIAANTLGWDFYDLDRVIEQQTGQRISEIFESKGEEFFRQLESRVLLEYSEKVNSIISLGGGTVTVEENIKIIKASGILIYLKITPETAYERLKFKRDRPILTRDGTVNLDKIDFTEKLAELMNKREKFYEAADVVFETEDSSIGKTVDKLVKRMKKELQFLNQ